MSDPDPVVLGIARKLARKGKPVTIADLMRMAQLDMTPAFRRLRALDEAGHLIRSGGERGMPLEWRLP